MGHYKRVQGKLAYAPSCFQESGAAAIVAASDLKKGQTVKISGKAHQYLGSTKSPDGAVHHFQNHNNGKYQSFHENDVPQLTSRDQMQQGDNSGSGDGKS